MPSRDLEAGRPRPAWGVASSARDKTAMEMVNVPKDLNHGGSQGGYRTLHLRRQSGGATRFNVGGVLGAGWRLLVFA